LASLQTSRLFSAQCILRGEAYLMLRDGKAAAPEFQKFIDHSRVVGNFPWGALARLGLARAYALNAAKDAIRPVPRIKTS
jgi:hypothetical protein